MSTKGTALIFLEGKVTLIYGSKEPERFQRILDAAFEPEQITFLWPTDYPIQTQAFGVRADYYSRFDLPGHEGIDMRALTGTPIRAVWGGKVIANYVGNAYGNQIRIEAEIYGETYKMIYAHFLEPSPLPVGAIVKQGDQIGLADSTGNTDGSHLHFTLKKVGATASGETNFRNDIIDPTNYFAELR